MAQCGNSALQFRRCGWDGLGFVDLAHAIAEGLERFGAIAAALGLEGGFAGEGEYDAKDFFLG